MIVLMSAFLLLSAFSCGGGNKANSTSEQDEKTVVNVPQFDADSAYLYVKNQVDFGPRVPKIQKNMLPVAITLPVSWRLSVLK